MKGRIRTMGECAVVDSNGTSLGIPIASLRFALVVFIACERGVTRDRAASVFWGDRSPRSARHSLSQTLHQIGQDLGDQWIETDGGALRLIDGIGVDLIEFEEAVEAEDFDKAVQLHSGAFLGTSSGSPTPEFERWVEGTRRRTTRSFAEAAQAVLEDLRAQSSVREMLRVAEQWTIVEPMSEGAVSAVMESLALAGRRTDALERYHAFVGQFESLYGAEPSDRIRSLAGRIRAGDLPVAVKRATSSEAPRVGPASAVETSGAAQSPVSGRGLGNPADFLRRFVPPVLVALVLVVVLQAVSTDREIVQGVFEIVAPPGLTPTEGLASAALSPDGRVLLLVGTDSSGRSQIWYRHTASLNTDAIPGTTGANFPFWAPDGERFGFFADHRIWIARFGQEGRQATSGSFGFEPRGASWLAGDEILYAKGDAGGLHLLSLADGRERQLTFPDSARGEIGHLWPSAHPDGEHFVYFVPSVLDSVRGIYLASRSAPDEAVRLVPSSGHGLISGQDLLFYERGQVLAIALGDTPTDGLARARTVLGGVGVDYTYRADFSAAPSGVLVHKPEGTRALSRFLTLDSAGRPLGTPSSARDVRNFAVSPDGRSIATQLQDGTVSDIVVIDRSTGAIRNVLTEGVGQSKFPVWSPDGTEIAYIQASAGGWDLFVQPVESGQPRKQVLNSTREPVPTDWSRRDGILFYRLNETEEWDVMAVDTAGGDPVAVLAEDGHQVGAQRSPSGRLLAYGFRAAGADAYHVYVLGDGGLRCQLTSRSGQQPKWGEDDATLFFASSDGRIVRVDLGEDGCQSARDQPITQRIIDNPRLARNHFDVLKLPTRVLVEQPIADRRMVVDLDWRLGPSN